MVRPPGLLAASADTGHDKRQIRDQENADRELFHKDRPMFNAKLRMGYEHQQKARQYSKEKRDSKTSRPERREQAEGAQAASRKAEEAMDGVRGFNEARAKENEPSGPQNGSK
jgi:hypothetical protein